MRAAVLLVPLLASALLMSRLPGHATAPFQVPAEGAYMVRELQAYSDAYWARVAGRDAGLPPKTNGHDEFAARWTNDILAALHGLHAAVVRQSFPAPGFKNLRATRPGVNVIVTVPGSQHPEKAVVIGTHYDGEPFSKGSAYDDASGCMVELGLAQALGALWRSRGIPSISVEFVLFDGEEEGLAGSLYYTTALARGAVMPSPVLMIDEEQTGVGYPVHPFGLAAQPPLPMIASTSERLPGVFGTPTPIPSANAQRLDSELGAAVTGAFTRLHAAYSPIAYGSDKQSVFTDADRHLIELGPSGECCSDNDPFALHGIANLTLSGNYDFYTPSASPWSYPFDQPWDTFTALACDTGGAPTPSASLEAAFDLPMAISALLVQRYAPPATGRGVAAFSALAQTGHAVRFTAVGASATRWTFGDGTSGNGLSPTHVYKRSGTYRVSLSANGATNTWTLRVRMAQLHFHTPFGILKPPPIRPWRPEQLRDIAGCAAALSSSS